MDAISNATKLKHLYARAGFGIQMADLRNQQHWAISKSVRTLFTDSQLYRPIATVDENTDITYNAPTMDQAMKMNAQEVRNRQERDLNISWMTLMSSTRAQLREKMTLFWHNHFSCRVGNFYYLQELNNIQRKYALGSFRQMLIEVSQTPAMLQFLNNQQNSKAHPNENFARELMELFTLGRGNYTEQDIKESARAFTGWAYDGKTGLFAFRENNHDKGPKTFFGKTGNWTGEDIINMILERPETAHYISWKLYKYLVNEDPDEAHVNEMADVFFKSGYELQPLLEHVFNASWFYERKNIGNLVKSPVELLVGLNRQFYITYQNPTVLMQFQRTLGQVLFNPPNVAGWPGGRNWIDSSSLMYRLKMPSQILSAGLIETAGKATPEEEAYLATMRKQQESVIKRVQATADLSKFIAEIPPKTSRKALAEFLLEPALSDTMATEAEAAQEMKALIVRLTSTPEYQLC